jgi:transcriptional regulator with XRE-family HTH domain
MEADDDGPLARALRDRMKEKGIGQRQLALAARVNETYVRDILKGRSRNPEAGKLGRVAAALDWQLADLPVGVSQAQPGEFVRDPGELILLKTWRKLPEQERDAVLDYIAFRLSQIGAPGSSNTGKTV